MKRILFLMAILILVPTTGCGDSKPAAVTPEMLEKQKAHDKTVQQEESALQKKK